METHVLCVEDRKVGVREGAALDAQQPGIATSSGLCILCRRLDHWGLLCVGLRAKLRGRARPS